MPDPPHVSTTRAAYDATARTYTELVGTAITDAIEAPPDQELLDAFVESVSAGVAGPVADVGCGPGRAASFLDERGLRAVGVDLSHAMLVAARTAHPRIPFAQAQLSGLPLRTGSLAGMVSWYSIIHTPPDHLDEVCAEFRRVLAPGGRVLIAFQSGDGDAVRRSEVHGTRVSLTSYRHSPDHVSQRLAAAELKVLSVTTRAPTATYETTPQSFIVARRGRRGSEPH